VAFVLRAQEKQREADFERQRWLNHELAGLIALAHHEPRKLPEYKPVLGAANIDRAPTEQDNARMRAFWMNLARRRTTDGT